MGGMQATLSREREFILRLSCPDTKGIVHAVSGLLFQAGCNIIDSQQFGDLIGPGATRRFFMRVHFEAPPQLADTATLSRMLSNVTQQFEMDSQLHSLARRPRVLLMVSQHGHCLNDLLFRWRSGQLDVDIPRSCPITRRSRTSPPATACRSITCRLRPARARRRGATRSSPCRRSWKRTRSTSSCWRATCRSCRRS